MTHEYVERLIRAYPDIREVWLIGSRANGRSRIDSDWDYLVFPDRDILVGLTEDKHFHDRQIDLLVVDPSGARFRKPWPDTEDGKLWHKKGTLGADDFGWRWTLVSEHTATYRSCHGVTNDPYTWNDRPTENAVRVYLRTET